MAFNSKEYSWADVEIQLQGRKVIGARGVKYKVSQEKEAVYGAGNEPITIGKGNKSYEGELTLLQSEVEALQRSVGTGNDIVDLPALDIIVSYAPKDGGAIVTDAIKFAEFTELEKGMGQNDKFSEISLPFIALKIDKNI